MGAERDDGCFSMAVCYACVHVIWSGRLACFCQFITYRYFKVFSVTILNSNVNQRPRPPQISKQSTGSSCWWAGLGGTNSRQTESELFLMLLNVCLHQLRFVKEAGSLSRDLWFCQDHCWVSSCSLQRGRVFDSYRSRLIWQSSFSISHSYFLAKYKFPLAVLPRHQTDSCAL